MFRFSAQTQSTDIASTERDGLNQVVKTILGKNIEGITSKNQTIFEAEVDRLDKWADDIKLSLELEIKAIDREIRQLKIDSKKSQLLADKVDFQKQIKTIEGKRNDKRRQLFEAQDQIEKEKATFSEPELVTLAKEYDPLKRDTSMLERRLGERAKKRTERSGEEK